MADQTTKTLTLKLTADTKGIDVVKNALKDLEKDTTSLSNLQLQSNALEEVKGKLLLQQAKQLEAINSSIASSKLKENFSAKVVEEFGNELSKVSSLLAAIKTNTPDIGKSLRTSATKMLSEEELKLQADSQGKYAAQRIKAEEDLADKTRKITLDSLRKTIEERNAILNAASKQRLGTAIGDITSAESSDRKKLLRSLREDMTERAKLQQEEFNLVERGLQQTRVREAERARLEETAARQRLERQAATNRQLLANETDFNERQRQNQLRGMRTSATEAFAPTPTARLSPIPRVPEDVRNSYDSLFARIGAINIEYRLWNTAINTVTESLRGIPRVGIELDSVKASLESTMGSTAAMNSALKALDSEAERTGINIGILRDNFKGFQASTSLSGVSLDSTWRMFTNLNTVITGLHLSADKANHVFLAMSQIFNKSKVQSEELVKQLGNLLPGAFASFAASMNIAPQELAKQMKAGTVFAKDTMENFIQYMATKFTPAFNASIDNLNANTGRMQTSFVHLQEAIYEKTAPAMNSFVKSVTETVKSMTLFVSTGDNLASTLQTVVVAALSLVAGHIAKLILAYAAMETQAKATKVAMMWSNAEAAAVITFFVTLGETISATYNEFEKIKNARRDFNALYKEALVIGEKELGTDTSKLKSEAELLKIRVEEDKTLGDINNKLTAMQAKMKDTPEQIKRDRGQALTKAEWDKINQDEAAITAVKEEAQTVRNKVTQKLLQQDKDAADKVHQDRIQSEKDFQEKMVTLADKIPKTQQEAVANALKTFREQTKTQLEQDKATIDRYTELLKKPTGSVKSDAIEKAKAEAEESSRSIATARETESRITEKAIKQYNDRLEAEQNRASSKRLAGIKEEISQVRQFERTAANDAENKINELNSENDRKVLSFEDYLRRKQAILDKDYNTEKDWYEKQRELAQQSGKKGLVTQAEEQLKRLEQDYQSKSKVAKDETATSMNEYETNLASIHQQYQDILGIERDSVEITKVKVELLNRQLEAEIREGGEAGAKAARLKEELVILNEAKNLKSKMAIYDRETATAEKIHADAISRINELQSAGQLNDLSAAMAKTEANQKLLAIREKDVALAKEALDLAREEARPAAQDKYDIAKQKLESLKLTADATGQFIEQSLGSAFESSFQGLITGTMNAQQAFKSFAASIVSDIAKIIAQEARSAILRPIIGAAFNALGGLFSSGPSVAAGNSTSFTQTMQGSNWMTAKVANGGVFSGAGISAHSGTMVNSPTLFPFAKGVGLMGEAGPEAILPLKRNSQGKLGVSVDNTGQQGGSNIYYVNTTVNAGSNASPDSIANKASEAIVRAIARQEINSAARPGNRLNQVTKYG
jgi:tape measure domain-containing protein